MPSLFLNRQSAEERTTLLHELHARQQGNCFICGKGIDLELHKNSIDIDHVVPISLNGPDNPGNFAVTHDSCNRGKQDSDLRVARIIARMDAINETVLIRERLEILFRLLSPDGSIWITIDDNEAHYLKVLCDEVFGRKNFISNVLWKKAHRQMLGLIWVPPMTIFWSTQRTSSQ